MSQIRKLTAEVRKLADESMQGRQRIQVTVAFRGKRKVVSDGKWWVFEGIFTVDVGGFSTPHIIKVSVNAKSEPQIQSMVVNKKEMGGTAIEGLFWAWMQGNPDAMKPPVY